MVDRMAYAADTEEKTPWNAGHDTTVALTGHIDAARMQQEAGLGWEVLKVPMFVARGEGYAEVPKTFALVREDTGLVLGTTGGAYKPVQNRRLFEIGESLLADGRVSWSTGGVINGGRRVFASYKMGDDWRVGDDEHSTYMFFHAGHDGKTGITYKQTAIRAVCDNTVDLALASSETDVREFVKHSQIVDDRLVEVSRILQISTAQSRRMVEFLTAALATEINGSVLDGVIESLFPEPESNATERVIKNHATAVRTFTNEFWLPEFNRTGATAYTLINAATGYADHGIRYYGSEDEREERRFAANVFDAGSDSGKIKATVMNLARSLVAV